MKVSVAWIAVGIIIGIVLYFTVEGFSIYEQFTNQVEGFADTDEYADSTDIKITSCPADTASYVDGGGRTVCCEGNVVNGKCSGKNVCSLSEPIAGLPTCSAWLDAYLENKGAKRCTPSMPKYYENKSQAGCTAGNRNAQGTAPASTSNKFCTLYRSEQDALLKLDSCENQKMLEEAKCLSKPTTRVLHNWGGVPPPVYCSGIDTGSLTPIACLDDVAFIRAADYWAKVYPPYMKNWKEQSINWGAQWKMNFCSVVQKVTIDKSLSFKDLEAYRVF